ncbi:hypothetical protein [Trinickia fusca]|uniref:Uncharacterized protein n=1 Tax=Trinickia fusca TaxID=2419777 RepID=A0A494WYV9_9BURK|nr:hypothetical protein [Trinickia fusca]RKP43717.1 hypothetical protein D7S89_25105 [Trinickia fusca]
MLADKKVADEFIERQDHSLEYVGSEIEKKAYYPARSMWLKLGRLQVVKQLAEPLDEDKQPTLSTSLHGLAYLDGRELAIIGDDAHTTRTVDVSFGARDVSTGDRVGLRQLEDELGISYSDVTLGTARLGFNGADDETGEPDQWWLACHIPQACLQALSRASADGQLGGVELGLVLRHLYTAENAPDNPARRARLFLRPDRSESDSTGEWPHIATGYVTHLRIDFATTELRGAVANGDEDAEGAMNPVADAVISLGAKLANLRLTVRWIGVLIIVLLGLEVLERL